MTVFRDSHSITIIIMEVDVLLWISSDPDQLVLIWVLTIVLSWFMGKREYVPFHDMQFFKISIIEYLTSATFLTSSFSPNLQTFFSQM